MTSNTVLARAAHLQMYTELNSLSRSEAAESFLGRFG
jgi:hypothetical protein